MILVNRSVLSVGNFGCINVTAITIIFLTAFLFFNPVSHSFAATASLDKTLADFNSYGANNITVSWSGFTGPIAIDFYENYSTTPSISNAWRDPATSGSHGFGSEGWPSNACGYQFKVRLQSQAPGTGVLATLNGSYDICVGSLTVTSPNSGDTLTGGLTYTITWSSNNVNDNIRIHLYRDNVYIYTIASSTPNNGTFIWKVPDSYEYSGEEFTIGISNVHANPLQNDGVVSDFSNGYFKIQDCMESIEILEPSAGDTLYKGVPGYRVRYSPNCYTGWATVSLLCDGYYRGSNRVQVEDGADSFQLGPFPTYYPTSNQCQLEIQPFYNLRSDFLRDQRPSISRFGGDVSSGTRCHVQRGTVLRNPVDMGQLLRRHSSACLSQRQLFGHGRASEPVTKGDEGLSFIPGSSWPASNRYQIRMSSLDGSLNTTSGYFTISEQTFRNLTVTIDPPGAGTVRGPGITCGSDCQQSFPYGTEVPLYQYAQCWLDVSGLI